MDQDEAEAAATAICSAQGLVVVRHVGAGAFKHAFEVRDSTGERRALKVYKRSASSVRTERELDAMSRCSHPSIASLVAHETTSSGTAFVLEEFVDGGTLTERLAGGTLDRATVLGLGRTLISALAHLAERRLVHRDIKPDNVMFRADGTPVLVDLGLVRDLDLESVTKTWADRGPGSPYFAAPEQLNNDKGMIDWRTDQFALGVLLSICRFGAHPFDDAKGDLHETVNRVASRAGLPPEYVQRARADALPCLERMVQPWPLYRYRTHEDLATAWAAQEQENP